MVDYSNIDIDTNDPGFDDLIIAATRSILSNYHSPIPAKVISFDSTTQRADVQPVFYVVDRETGNAVPMPIFRSLPVAYPKWSTGSIYWPLTVGSYVMVVPCDVDISTWMSNGNTNEAPATHRSCDWSDSVIFPGMLPDNAPLATAAVSTDGTVLEGKVYLGSSQATDYVALASLVKAELNKIRTAYNTHKHIETGGTTEAPSIADQISVIAEVKSTKVMAI